MGTAVLVSAGILAIMIVFLLILARRYVRVGPNEALIVTGQNRRVAGPDGRERPRGFRIVTGGATFVIPVIEKAEVLSLEMLGVRVAASGVEASAHVKIGRDHASIAAAAERFLSKRPEEVATIAGDLLTRHLRAALAGGKTDPPAVEEDVARRAKEEFAGMGLELVSFSIGDPGHAERA
jgi:flotillin